MTLDGELRGVANELIGEFGKAIIYNRVSQTAYDATTGTTGITNELYSVKCAIEEYRDTGYNPGMIAMGDKKVTIAASALGFAPTPDDTLTVDGVIFKLVACETVYSGELAALYIAQARRA